MSEKFKIAYTALLSAIRHGADLIELKRIFADDHRLNVNGCYGTRTPLCHAIRHGKLETVKALVEIGADIDKPDAQGWTALFQALESEEYAIMAYLLESGCNKNFLTNCSTGYTCLHRAVQKDRMPAVRLLVQHGCDVNISRGDSPLHIACLRGDLSTVRLLVDAGADVKKKTFALGYTCLHLAVEQQNLQLVKILLPLSDVDEQNSRGEMAIHLAVCTNNAKAIHLLANAGSDINASIAKDGEFPLLLAVRRLHLEAVKALIELDCDTNQAIHQLGLQNYLQFQQPINDLSILTMVASSYELDAERYEVARLLLSTPRTKVNHRLRMTTGEHAIHLAAKRGHLNLIQLLLENGAHIDATDNYHRTPLLIAVQEKHSSIVNYLVNCGSRLNRLEPVAIDSRLVAFISSVFDVDFCDWLLKMHSSPRPLRVICCNVIRQFVHSPFSENVDQLKISKLLKREIAFAS